MVIVLAVKIFNMQRYAGGLSKGLKPFLEQFSIHIAQLGLGEGHFPYEIGALGNIQRYACAGFIHRDGCRAIARQPFEVAQRLAHGFADNNAGIFRRVVKINMQIALSRNFQVDQE